MILATDLGVAKEFYGDRVGLEVLIESDDFLTFSCGGDSRLVVTRSTAGTSEPQTKAAWRVSDLAAEVANLRPGVGSRNTTSPAEDRRRHRRRRLRARGLVRRPRRKLDRAAAAQGHGGALTGDAVITTVTRRVRPGHEAAYEEFLEGIISAARRFPGHLGSRYSARRAQRRVPNRLPVRQRRAPARLAGLRRARPGSSAPNHTSSAPSAGPS